MSGTRWHDHPKRHLCHETLYRALYQGAKGGLSRTLTRKLRTDRPLRKKRRRSDQRMPRFVAPAVLIDRRPSIIELRERLGNWEGDLVVGARSQSAVATLVDRRTRYLCLVPLPEGLSARQLRDALTAGVVFRGPLPGGAVQEEVRHVRVEAAAHVFLALVRVQGLPEVPGGVFRVAGLPPLTGYSSKPSTGFVGGPS
ncbi:IS30 family transposase [Streptomyces sp. NPDC057336]|uniref:IS30 family transposase n=1 Tax=Streptomyces sp. NPDC057336 TaxID=3346102 RepID=UPI0036337348